MYSPIHQGFPLLCILGLITLLTLAYPHSTYFVLVGYILFFVTSYVHLKTTYTCPLAPSAHLFLFTMNAHS